jgi:hypothetical protein
LIQRQFLVPEQIDLRIQSLNLAIDISSETRDIVRTFDRGGSRQFFGD